MIKDFSNNNYKSKIRIKKDYRRKSFINPYFNNTHKNETSNGFNTKLYLKIILVVFIIYVIIYSDLFKIEKININGADLINKTELEQIVNEQINSWRFFVLPQKNLLLISKKKINEAISQRYGLEKIEIKRGWKKITINIKEKINYLIVNDNEKLFFSDNQGIVIREISQEEANRYNQDLPTIKIKRELNIGDQAVSDKMVDFILQLNEKLKSLGIEISNYESGGVTEVTFITKAGWQAHFDINNDFNISIENMKMVLNDKIKDTTKLEYIDLRFGDKIYYK